jgi:hypothetical protein
MIFTADNNIVSSSSSPKLSTIEEYARAVGYKVEINFVPIKSSF